LASIERRYQIEFDVKPISVTATISLADDPLTRVLLMMLHMNGSNTSLSIFRDRFFGCKRPWKYMVDKAVNEEIDRIGKQSCENFAKTSEVQSSPCAS
jgi:hypothetical protein